MEQTATQLALYCQPIYRCGEDQATVQDYELLLRRQDGYPLTSYELTTMNSDPHQRHQLERWILEELDRFYARYSDAELAINVDPWQFQYSDEWEYLAALAAISCNIKLEMTERHCYKQAADFAGVLQQVSHQNMGIALDDVGAGDNSLQTVINSFPYLKRIKFSLLLFQAGDTDLKVKFAAAWQALAASRGLELVVEGIEDALLAHQLVDVGCVLQQGFYWARPFPLAEFDQQEPVVKF